MACARTVYQPFATFHALTNTQFLPSPVFTSTSTATMFLNMLPPEVRVQIYQIMIQETVIAKSHSPHDYIGLILSCKEINREYSFEANKSTNHIRTHIENRWKFPQPLVLQPSAYTCPMQYHVSIPPELLHLPIKRRGPSLFAFIPLSSPFELGSYFPYRTQASAPSTHPITRHLHLSASGLCSRDSTTTSAVRSKSAMDGIARPH